MLEPVTAYGRERGGYQVLRIRGWSSDVCSSDLSVAGMDHGAGGMQAHAAGEAGNPLVDMQTMTPVPKLNDPGMGLMDNGRKVLSYAMLKSAFADPYGRDPSRDIELHLTGHMEKFAWSFRSEEHTSELQSLMRISYAVFCLKKKNKR